MSYFKARPAQPIKRPAVKKVIWVQTIVTLVGSVLTTLFAPIIGLTVLLGGVISIAGQLFYFARALRHFGHPEAHMMVASTYSAMWGKWLIVIAGSMSVIMLVEEIHAGVLFLSLFTVHTVGAFLIPILVKKSGD